MLILLNIFLGFLTMNAFSTSPTTAYINAKIYSGSELKTDIDAFLVRDGRFFKLAITKEITKLIGDIVMLSIPKRSPRLTGFHRKPCSFGWLRQNQNDAGLKRP